MVSKDEEQWWTARNCLGQTGSIPVPYMEIETKVQEGDKDRQDNINKFSVVEQNTITHCRVMDQVLFS